MQDPLAEARKGGEARGVEHVGGEVAAEDAPRGAVRGGADVKLLMGGEGFVGAVGEDGTVLD